MLSSCRPVAVIAALGSLRGATLARFVAVLGASSHAGSSSGVRTPCLPFPGYAALIMGIDLAPRRTNGCGPAVAIALAFSLLGCGPPSPGPTVISQATRVQPPADCQASLRNPAAILPGTWDAVYVDRDGTGEDTPYTGPRTFTLQIWPGPYGLTGTMTYPVRFQPVILPISGVNVVGGHVTLTAPVQQRVLTIQGVLQCPGPVLDGNKTLSTDPDVTPLRFQKRPGS